MNRIICPTDFSQASLNAIEVSTKLAELNHSSLTLYHTYTESEYNEALGQGPPGGGANHQLDVIKEKLAKLVETINQNSLSKGLLKCDYKLEMGRFPERLAAYAKKINSDAIVMGTTGVSNLQEAYMGSNTLNTIEKAHCTVFCIPESASYKKFEKIVYATDFKKEDHDAIQKVVALAMRFEAWIYVLHISQAHNEKDSQEFKKEVAEFKSFIEYERMVYVNKAFDDEVSHGIESFVKEEKADLLAVVTKERYFLLNLFHKSVTKSLTYILDNPMMIIK